MDTKRCTKCGEVLPLDRFNRNKNHPGGLQCWCKVCQRAGVKAWRQANRERALAANRKWRAENPDKHRAACRRWNREHPDYRRQYQLDHPDMVREWRRRYEKRYPEKLKARHALRRAVKSGRLKRGPCAVCGTRVDVHAHHDDYAAPLAVVWLCRQHHHELHRWLRRTNVA